MLTITLSFKIYHETNKVTYREDSQGNLFRSPLENIISLGHSLVKLSKAVDWETLDKKFGVTFCEDNGRPGIPTRLMTALHYLKFTYNLSDESVVKGWAENPYWQYLSGMKYFEHELPCAPSSMTRWQKRIGEAGAEELLIKTIEAGLVLKAVKKTQLRNINVDTTVQEKDVRFPTDARLYDRARERLVKAANDQEINLRQNYNRLSKQALLKTKSLCACKANETSKEDDQKTQDLPWSCNKGYWKEVSNP